MLESAINSRNDFLCGYSKVEAEVEVDGGVLSWSLRVVECGYVRQTPAVNVGQIQVNSERLWPDSDIDKSLVLDNFIDRSHFRWECQLLRDGATFRMA